MPPECKIKFPNKREGRPLPYGVLVFAGMSGVCTQSNVSACSPHRKVPRKNFSATVDGTMGVCTKAAYQPLFAPPPNFPVTEQNLRRIVEHPTERRTGYAEGGFRR